MALITSFWLYDIFVLVGGSFLALYAFFCHKFKYWKTRGFEQLTPSFPMGNFPGMGRKRNMDTIMADLYFENPDKKIVAAYLITRPILIIRDLELVKSILIKDFTSFHDRMDIKLEHDAILQNLFMLQGKEWRNLRIKLTPTFTSGKMKIMFNTLLDVGKQLYNVWEEGSKEEEIGVKDVLSRYTTDVIGSVAFGIEINSLKHPDHEFRKLSSELSRPGLRQGLVFTLIMAAPKLADKLKPKFFSDELTNYFKQIVKETLDYRRKNNYKRNDFMDSLLELLTQGYVKDPDNPQNDVNEDSQQKFTLDLATAQAFIFFAAGFETASSTMQFALYELALNPQIQTDLQDEIDATLKQCGGEWTYDDLMKMELLDRIVAETLRKYPAAGVIFRKCTQDYQIPDTDQKIIEGETVWLPVYAIHRDPNYYPDPEKFDPDRFLPEVKKTRPDFSYLPFGDGPRSCIGNRFGLMETKVGLALTLQNFTVSPSRNTPIPIVFDPTVNALTPKGLLKLKITKRHE